jgi:hypothetical protein
MIYRISILLFSFLFTLNLNAQNEKLKIFVDCNQQWLCDQDYLRNELNIVDFVRDRFLCDLQIISNVQFGGAGGETNVLRFIGQKNYTGMVDTMSYFNDVTATEDGKRKKMLKYIQIGLLPYILKGNTNLDLIELGFKKDTAKQVVKTKDPWNYFQFSIGSSGFFNGNKNTSDSNIANNFSITRETTNNRFNFEFFNQIQRNKFTYFNQNLDTTEVIKVVNDSQNLFTRYTVKSNEHWGYGIRAVYERSIFDNIDYRIAAFPMIEYSIFPYSDYNSSRLVLSYAIGSVNFNYKDTTIYLKTKENLVRQDFNATASFTKAWGDINVGASFTNYMHDFSKNNFNLGGSISWNIFQGFKFSVGGNFQFLRDQLSLPKADATRDDLLTQRRLIASSYDYFGGVGFSYTFGSIYNSQVHQTFRGLNWGINF